MIFVFSLTPFRPQNPYIFHLTRGVVASLSLKYFRSSNNWNPYSSELQWKRSGELAVFFIFFLNSLHTQRLNEQGHCGRRTIGFVPQDFG